MGTVRSVVGASAFPTEKGGPQNAFRRITPAEESPGLGDGGPVGAGNSGLPNPVTEFGNPPNGMVQAVGGKHDNVVALAALKFHQTKIGLGPVDAVCTLCIGGGGAAGCSAAACVVAVVVWVLD